MVRVTANSSVEGMGATFCTGCTYTIGVHSSGATEYSITASRIGGTTLLQVTPNPNPNPNFNPNPNPNPNPNFNPNPNPNPNQAALLGGGAFGY